MGSLQLLIIFAALIQFSHSLVEFSKSKLYEETDFAVSAVSILGYGSSIYVSVPEASAAIAKKIMVHDYVSDEISLYDISKLKKDYQKGYYEVPIDIQQVKILNKNTGYATAPIAVWVVRKNSDVFGHSMVFDAANLSLTSASFDVFTVMSVEPFTLRSKTEGPMRIISTMTGFDAIGEGGADVCTNVIDQMNPDASSNIQISVQSPLISFYYDDQDFENTKTSIQADIGNDKSFDFSGISFVASPGYIGCSEHKTFRSSLYNSSTSFQYSSSRSYNVMVTSVLNTDTNHPVTVKDSTNGKEYKWSGTTPGNTNEENLTLQQTNNVEISWTRNEQDLDKSFLVRIVPSD